MILDLSAGNRAIWFDKNRDDCIFVDRRRSARATVVADSTRLPFPDSTFELVVFDPPHVNAGRHSRMAKGYGWHTTMEIRDLITATAYEAHRVTVPAAMMAFKWNDHDQQLGPIIALMDEFWEFLCGHSVSLRMKRHSETFWALLRRRQ